MFKRILGLKNCLSGKHERCADRAHKVGDSYVSVCMHCGVRMRRRAKRDWIVERHPG